MRITDSYAEEFMAKFNRISSIIKHGPSIGNYHENVVRSFLSDFLVNRYSIKTGFIYNNEKDKVSKQIDIIIVDESIPSAYYFKEKEFVIVDKKAAVCGIEIKSQFNQKNFEDISIKAYDYYDITKTSFFIAFVFESKNKEQLKVLKHWYENIKDIPDKIDNYPNSIFILNKGFIQIVPPKYATTWGNYYSVCQNKDDYLPSTVVSWFLAQIMKICEMRQNIKDNPFKQYSDHNYIASDCCLRYGNVFNQEKILT